MGSPTDPKSVDPVSGDEGQPIRPRGRYFVSPRKCQGRELCVHEAPNNFAVGEHYKTYVKKQPASQEEELQSQRAVDACPFHAIYNNLNLRWTTERPAVEDSSGWKLSVFIPAAICADRTWSPEHSVIVVALARGNSPTPPFDDLLGAGTHRYLNLKSLSRRAPIRRMMFEVNAFITSQDLYINPLISASSSGEPIWKDVDWRYPEEEKRSGYCPMLHLSDDLAVAAFFVTPSNTWNEQLLLPGENQRVYDSSLIGSARPALATFGISIGGLVLAQTTAELRVSGLGEGPVHQHSSTVGQKVFASYAQPDIAIVELADSILHALGLGELRWDQKILESGMERTYAVNREIMTSDVFQLFWSENSKRSDVVREEWRYALSLSRENFIRPVYWTTSFPSPPSELKHLFFSKLRYSDMPPSIIVRQASMLFGAGSTLAIERIEHVEKQYNIDASGQGNIINIAEYMTGITNTVNQNVGESSASNEVKELLRTLAAQLSAAAPKIDPAVAEQMGSDVKALSEEVKKTAPRKAWYKLTLDGLKEAAEAIGKVGVPILEVVSKLVPILMPG